MRCAMVTLGIGLLTGCGLFGSDPDTDTDTVADSDTEATDIDGTDNEDDDTEAEDIVPTNCRSTDFRPDDLPNTFPDSAGFSVDSEAGGEGMMLIVNSPTTGVFDLEYDGGNPLSYDRCVILLTDEGWYAGFRGQMEVLERPTESSVSIRLVDAEFRELDDSFQPVSDGDCVAVDEPMILSTEPVVLLPSDCPQLSVDTSSLRLDGLFGGYFVADVTDPTGDLSGQLNLEFFASQTGLFDLTTGDNANYSTCEQCVGVVGDAPPRAFQSRGVVRVDSDPTGNSLDIVLTNVELTEVTVGEGLISTPVPNGRCWSLPNPLPLQVQ